MFFHIKIEYKWSQFSIQRHRMVVWIKKQDWTICCLQEMHLTDKDKLA
jgi:hypothetical protein